MRIRSASAAQNEIGLNAPVDTKDDKTLFVSEPESYPMPIKVSFALLMLDTPTDAFPVLPDCFDDILYAGELVPIPTLPPVVVTSVFAGVLSARTTPSPV
jgi:hypothetical protein